MVLAHSGITMVSSSMEKTGPKRIFISYAHRDGSNLALRLQNDLTTTGFDVWLDKQRLHGGQTWTLEIEKAIDRAQVFLALISPGSYASEICRCEQLRSLRKGKCVIPLLAVSGSDIPCTSRQNSIATSRTNGPTPEVFDPCSPTSRRARVSFSPNATARRQPRTLLLRPWCRTTSNL